MVTGESAGAEKRTVIAPLGGRTPRGTITVGGGWRVFAAFMGRVGVAVALAGDGDEGAAGATDELDGAHVGVGEGLAVAPLETDVPVGPSRAIVPGIAGVLVAGRSISVGRGDAADGGVGGIGAGVPVAVRTVVAGGDGRPVKVGVGVGVGEGSGVVVDVSVAATVGVSLAVGIVVGGGVVAMAVAVAMTVGVSATTVVVVMGAVPVGMSVAAGIAAVALDDADRAGMLLGVTGTVGTMVSAGAVAVVLAALPMGEGMGAVVPTAGTGTVADGSAARAPAWYPGRASMLTPQSSSRAAYCPPRRPCWSVPLAISDPGPFPCSSVSHRFLSNGAARPPPDPPTIVHYLGPLDHEETTEVATEVGVGAW